MWLLPNTLLMDYGYNASNSAVVAAAGCGGGGGGGMTVKFGKMTLHIGEREFILFDFWKTGSLIGLCASMLIIILMCVLYEAIKALREFLMKIERCNTQQRRLQHHNNSRIAAEASSVHSREQPTVTLAFTGGESAPNVVYQPYYHRNVRNTDSISSESLIFAPLLRTSGVVFTQYRVIQCLLYACQVTLSYTLIMVVMTFNLWLLLAVIVGEALGYLLFSAEPSSEECLYDASSNEMRGACQ